MVEQYLSLNKKNSITNKILVINYLFVPNHGVN